VTTPRNDVHIVVTEHGWVDLRGKSLTERARALIGIADPGFRDQLAAKPVFIEATAPLKSRPGITGVFCFITLNYRGKSYFRLKAH
jgi:hypothetical protein